MWYTPDAQMTYNRIFNFAVSVRGGGKTFSLLKKGIDKFLKDGTEFIYLRRRQVDIDDSVMGKQGSGDLFNAIRYAGLYEGHEIKVTGDKSGGYNFYIDDRLMGYGRALSTARRSVPLPNVKLIIFDEFLIDDSPGSNDRYLNSGNETFLFYNFYETVTRGRDVPVFFLGNAFSMVNPYFIDLNIRIEQPDNNKIYKSKSWTVIFWKDEAFIDERSKTQFFQATKHTKFNDHAFGNTFYLDRKDFIKKRTQDSEHQFSIVYLGHTYGVWVDWSKGEYYVSKKGAKAPAHKTISLSLQDNTPNNVSIRRYRNMPFMKMFRAAADTNRIWYDSQESFNRMNEAVYLLKTIT